MHHDSGDRPAKGKNRQHTPPVTGAHSALEGVKQLLAERAKFEKWLTDLDAKRASTPAKVFERVRGDYSTRLQGVLDQLKEHSSAMQQHSKSLSEKLSQLTESEQELLETRAESELRAEVGELSEGEWERTSKKLEKDLAKIKQDQELIQSDLNDLRELLAAFDGAPAKPAEPAQKAPDATPPPERTATTGDENVDELAFLKSVIGTAPTAARPAAQPMPPAAAPVPAKAAAQPAKERLVQTPPPGPVIKSKPGEEPLAMHVTGSNPIVLRSSGVVEQPKTLKCAECGAMNYPSEWYCERCGAELTAA